MKTCTQCNVAFPLSEYHADRCSSDGKRSACNRCRSAQKRAYLARNRHVDRAQKRRYHLENMTLELWRSAKRRARRKGLAFTLDLTDIVIPNACPVLCTPFDFSTGHGKIPDFAPTLDRIDRRYGYIPGNTAVISWRANRMKYYWTLEELSALVSWLSRPRGLGR